MIRSPTFALVILTLINLLNYLDRYTVAAIQPRVKEALSLSDFELGALSSSFVIVYMLTSPIFGRLGDRRSRPRLIAFGVMFWSLATAAAGLARSFGQIFASRAAVGVGEAAYGTISPSLLADDFSEAKRGRIFAVFFAAIPVGSALAYKLIGGLVEPRYGWRMAFFVAGLPGLLLALSTLLIADPPRGAADDRHAGGEPALRANEGVIAVYLRLLRIPVYAQTVLGYAAYTFALGGLAIWMPTFLERVRGIPLASANDSFGKITVIAGFLGTFAGGWAGDRALARGVREAYLLVSGVATLIAVPATIAALSVPNVVTISLPLFGELSSIDIAIFASEFLLFASTGPINTVVVNVVPAELRASAVALSILAIHLLGDAISPSIIGFASDRMGLARAVFIVPFMVLVSGAVWTRAALAREARAG